jgi:4-amino-4-deoxy-L-arabinose transferase-like glycosyltransferase
VLTVALTALKLHGRRAALLSMLAAAVLPMLVTRSSVVVVDTFAAFFTVLSLCFALYSVDSVWDSSGSA